MADNEKVICRVPFRHEVIHICEHLVAACSDFRFEDGICKVKRVLDIKGSDSLFLPGGIRVINDPVTEQYAHDKIELLIGAHGIKKFHGFNHAECGDYKKAGISFDDFDREQEFHFSELHQAGGKVHLWFPKIKIQLAYARISRNRKHIEFVEVE
jgi:hypothetical protein